MADELYHLANIYKLLQVFTDEELRRWCFDTPDLRPVYDRFSKRTGKAEVINQLLAHTRSQALLAVLLEVARASNPDVYKAHEPYLKDIDKYKQLMKTYLQKAEISQSQAARKLGCDRALFKRWINGQPPMPYKVLIEFAKLVKLDEIHMVELCEVAGYPRPSFPRRRGVFKDETVQVIVCHLDEWKIVHTTTQDLLMSTMDDLKRALQLFDEQKTEITAKYIERVWSSECEPKAVRIRESIKSLQFIKDSIVSHLNSKLEGEQYVPRCIGELRVNDIESIQRLEKSVYGLLESLIHTLRLVDRRIIEIAEELKYRYH